eukprot:g28868.t1
MLAVKSVLWPQAPERMQDLPTAIVCAVASHRHLTEGSRSDRAGGCLFQVFECVQDIAHSQMGQLAAHATICFKKQD